jgi:hypothetical protein
MPQTRRNSEYSGEHLPPVGKYGVTEKGYVWLNSDPVQFWSPESNWEVSKKPSAKFKASLMDANVGYRSSFDAALAAAKSRASGTPAPVPAPGGAPVPGGEGAPTPGTETPFYEKGWFLPVVGVSALGIVLAIALWPSSKPETAKV